MTPCTIEASIRTATRVSEVFHYWVGPIFDEVTLCGSEKLTIFGMILLFLGIYEDYCDILTQRECNVNPKDNFPYYRVLCMYSLTQEGRERSIVGETCSLLYSFLISHIWIILICGGPKHIIILWNDGSLECTRKYHAIVHIGHGGTYSI